jgi:hypothetical protein
MRCENKPLLQDDPGFLQEITSIAVEVGLGLGRHVPAQRWPLDDLVFAVKSFESSALLPRVD